MRRRSLLGALVSLFAAPQVPSSAAVAGAIPETAVTYGAVIPYASDHPRVQGPIRWVTLPIRRNDGVQRIFRNGELVWESSR